MNNPLTAISPLDGRYAENVAELREYFSEFALMRTRIYVEIQWFITLCNTFKLAGTRKLKPAEIKKLNAIAEKFNLREAIEVKQFERKVNHDVKAAEYYIKEKMAKGSMKALTEFIHFGCTSEDINNMSYALMMKKGLHNVFLPLLAKIINDLKKKTVRDRNLAMLAHTHGQPATPTTLGKEYSVFSVRLERQFERLNQFRFSAKFNGATGNYAAHVAAYPKFNWIKNVREFIEHQGLVPNMLTTQIEPHDYMADIFDHMRHVNNILIGCARDMWLYISYEYLAQKKKEGEVGSSTMPHKVNPIDFENAEGNCEIGNALLVGLSNKLPISRMQRDLSDSTVQRNVGSAFGYCIIAMKSLLKGLDKIEPNEKKLTEDLDNHWEVLTEAVQTVMRKNGIQNAYEKLKNLSRGEKITRETLRAFIEKLDIPEKDKKRLLALTPKTYIGLSEQLVTQVSDEPYGRSQ